MNGGVMDWPAQRSTMAAGYKGKPVFAAYSAFDAARLPFVMLLPLPLGALPTETWAVIVSNLKAVTLVIIVSACLIALARKRARQHHYRMALRDGLIGIRNRRAYQETLRTLEAARPFAMLVFDIDRFKSINDAFGHKLGDQVIILAARAGETALRKLDMVFRIGGEEFVCILPDVTAAEARHAAERLRTTFQTIAATVDGKAVNATISIGVAASDGKSPSPDDVFAQADAALYRAKQGGRNRTVVAETVAAGPLQARSGHAPARPTSPPS